MLKNMSVTDFYFEDINVFDSFDADINFDLLKELDGIKKELFNIFLMYEDETSELYWIADKIDCIYKLCKDSNLLKQLKNTYDKYILIRDKIINGNLKLVILIANRLCANKELIYDDMIQYGNMGLMRAIEKFDLAKDIKFSTYASTWISGTIRHKMRFSVYPTEIPVYLFDDYMNLRKLQDKLCVERGREIGLVELAENSKYSLERVREIFNAFDVPHYLDEPLKKPASDYEYTLKDLLKDHTIDICAQMIEKEKCNDIRNLLNNCLTPKQLFVILNYYGFENNMYSLQRLSEIMGISIQAVSDLKERAIKKLQKNIKRSSFVE